MPNFWRYTGRMIAALVAYTIVFFVGGQHLYSLGVGLVAVMVWLDWTS